MDGMPMPGGWSLSMMWMRMPGQTWSIAAVSFLGMWTLMMFMMMLPVLTPQLMAHRRTLHSTHAVSAIGLTAYAGIAYFCVWAAIGAAVYPMGVLLAAAAMREPLLARSVPVASGVLLLILGFLQFSQWKMRRLECCRITPSSVTAPSIRSAWRHGMRLGFDCCRCCANLMAITLIVGLMDLRVMLAATIAIGAERLAPRTARAPQIVGTIVVAAGLYLIVRATSSA